MFSRRSFIRGIIPASTMGFISNYLYAQSEKAVGLGGASEESNKLNLVKSDVSNLFWKRKPLSSAINSVQQSLDSTMISPWEFAYLVNDKDAGDYTTWDWSPAIQAAINAAFTRSVSGKLFNNGLSSSMGGVNLGGMTYSISSTIFLPDSSVMGGGGGSFIIQNGRLVARCDFPKKNSPLLRLSSVNNNNWTQNVYLNNVEVDCANVAEIGIEVQKSMGTFIDACCILRYVKYGVKVWNKSYNCVISRCVILSYPYGTKSTGVVPFGGVFFGNSDSVVSGCIIVGNHFGVIMGAKTRCYGNHIYGNAYSINYNTQFGMISGNYLEDPILSGALQDCTITGNFFSESIRGGAVVITGGKIENLAGTSIVGNSRAYSSLLCKGDLLFSERTGYAICMCSSELFFVYDRGVGHVHDGAVITVGDIYAIVIPNDKNTTSSVSVFIVGDLPSKSIKSGDWEQKSSFISLACENQKVSSSAVIEHSGSAINNQLSHRLSLHSGGVVSITSQNQYSCNIGDGKGDLWIGNNSDEKPLGIAIGVVTGGVNNGTINFWARGGKEIVNWGTFRNGNQISLRNGAFIPAKNNSVTLGDANNCWKNIYSCEGVFTITHDDNIIEYRSILDKERNAAINIKDKMRAYKLNNSPSVSDNKWRFGVSAKDIMKILTDEGLDYNEYNFLFQMEGQGGDILGVKYDELFAFIIAAI